MTNREIQEMITVSQWGMWLQYVKKNNVKNEGGHWPDYEFHEFYTSLGWTEVEGEAAIQQDTVESVNLEGPESSV